MLSRLIGPGSKIDGLKQGLDASSVQVRALARRVANASTPGFSESLRQAQDRIRQPDVAAGLESDMISLANEQIRFEATARLLQGSYSGLRKAIRQR